MKEKNATQKIVIAALLAALACVATMIIKIPSPLKGYLNLGDCVILLAGWMLNPVYGQDSVLHWQTCFRDTLCMHLQPLLLKA